MKRHLEKPHAKATPLDKTWTIIEFLENEARDYIIKKSEAERDIDEKFSRYLRGGSERDQARSTFNNNSVRTTQIATRTTCNISLPDYMQYLPRLLSSMVRTTVKRRSDR